MSTKDLFCFGIGNINIKGTNNDDDDENDGYIYLFIHTKVSQVVLVIFVVAEHSKR